MKIVGENNNFEKMNCKDCAKTTEGKSYLYNNRCRGCQRFRRNCPYIN